MHKICRHLFNNQVQVTVEEKIPFTISTKQIFRNKLNKKYVTLTFLRDIKINTLFLGRKIEHHKNGNAPQVYTRINVI